MGILGGFGEFFGSLFAPQAVEQRNVSPAGAKIQVLDAIHPRKLCLGTKAWPSSIMWHNSHRWGGGDTPRDTYTMVLALSDQLSGPIQAIWLDNERFTVGTNTSSGGSGQDFVPTSNFTSQWSSNPTGFNAWYGPNLNKVPVSSRLAKHVREDGGSFRSDIQFRYFDGSQTAADDLLNQLPNYQTDNGVGQSRVFRRITYLAVSLRAGLSTVGGGGNFGGSDIGPRVPAILVESRGNREVYDWRTGTVSYSENAALCMARWMMWEYGPLARVDDNFDLLYPLPSDFSVDDMSFAADLCDQNVTILSGSATQARYQVDAEIEADRSASNIFEQFSFALGGVKVFRRQSTGKWVIRPGHYAPPVMTIPERDYLPGPVRTRHRTPRQERKNGIQVKYTSQNQAYELVDSEIVTDSDYLAEDGGVQKLHSFKADFVVGKHRAERLGLIWLQTHRLQKIHQAAFPLDAGVVVASSNRGVIRLELGDNVKINNERYGYVDQQFTVETKGYDPLTGEIGLQLRETGAGFVNYDGHNGPNDETNPSGPNWWGQNELAKLTDLDGFVIEGSSDVQGDGRLWVSVIFDWPNHADVRVEDRGQYRLEYKRSADTKWSAVVSVDSRNTVKMQSGVTHRVRVRAETLEGRSDWYPDKTGLSYTPASDVFGPERLGGEGGQNVLSDPRIVHPFNSTVGNGLKLGSWSITNADGGAPTPVATSLVVTDTGFWSVTRNGAITLTSIRMQFADGEAGDSQRFSVLEYIPVTPGQIWVAGATIMLQSVSSVEIRVLFYNANRSFIANGSALVNRHEIDFSGDPLIDDWVHLYAPVVIPQIGGVNPAFVRLQYRQIKVGGFTETAYIDGLMLRLLNAAQRPYKKNEEITWTGFSTYIPLVWLGNPQEYEVDPDLEIAVDGFWANGSFGLNVECSFEAQIEVTSGGGTGAAKTTLQFYLAVIDVTHPYWQKSTVYNVGDHVRCQAIRTAPARIYVCTNSGTSAGTGRGPSGTGSGIVDFGAVWDFVGPLADEFLSTTKSRGSFASNTVGEFSSALDVRFNIHATAADLIAARPLAVVLYGRMDGTSDTNHHTAIIRDIRMEYTITEANTTRLAGT